ncbi:MAG: crossover junction endodeoxyribonuclease RuvC [Candidatus Wildermuthbacteria bacterium]|nr:crossover junction endodeoxyribonuclease RuvC [Candidatus Wildermuthbacteria bacterium]
MVILGIDPGTARTGYGVIRKIGSSVACIEYGCIETSKLKKPEERLLSLEEDLLKVLKKHKPDIMVVERLYFFKNLKSVMPVSEARGVILLAIAKKKLPVFEITPLQAKMAITGYGRADKKQVQRMVQRVLKLKDLPKPDDAADALAMAIAYAFNATALSKIF